MGNKKQSGSKTSQIQIGCTDFGVCCVRPWEHHPFPTQERRHHHFAQREHTQMCLLESSWLCLKTCCSQVLFVFGGNYSWATTCSCATVPSIFCCSAFPADMNHTLHIRFSPPQQFSKSKNVLLYPEFAPDAHQCYCKELP